MRTKNELRKFRQNREKQFNRVFKAVSTVFKNFADKASTSVQKADMFDLIPWDELDDDLIEALVSSMSFTTKDFAKYVTNLFDYSSDNDLINTISNKYMKNYKKNVAKKVSGITDKIRKSVASTISDGQNKGLTTRAIADKLSDKFNELSEGRARVIARTEVNSTTNNVHEMIADSVGLSKRIWIHTGAGKTSREHHKSLDKTSVKFNEKFKVGNYEALHPHDSSLPASEVVSCHCFTIYE